MSRLKSIFRNIRALLDDDLQSRWQAQETLSAEVLQQLEAAEARARTSSLQLETRADAYEGAVDQRIAERAAALEKRLDDYQAAVDARIEERITVIEQRLDEYRATIDARIDERLTAVEATLDARLADHQKLADKRAETFETALTARLSGFEHSLSERATEYESATAARLETFEAAITSRANDYESALDSRIETRIAAAEAKLDGESAGLLARVDGHFDARSLATDNRLDDRLARIERHIDTRFDTLEKRSDDRMETHERTVDGKLHQRSQDIVDRNDLMLQVFDQQLDRFRRQLRSVNARMTERPAGSSAASENGGSSETGVGNLLKEEEAPIGADDPPHQLVSFRKLAGLGAMNLRKAAHAAPPLYHQILAWKKTAHEGLTDFAPDEQEIVDYILSFQSEDREIAYVKQHLRRFVSTIERVPVAETPGDRLLELGSLGHLAPAIRKFCGYDEVFCGDLWEGDERVRIETLKQVNGPDTQTFELRNFNVEADNFPYPDRYFKTVLCCELIEHLRRDPLHMLWECNRVLVDDGFLLLTTPNIVSARAIEGLFVGCTPYLLSQYNLKEVAGQHNREYAPYEIGVALASAGFSVVALETEDVWLRSNPAIIELLKEIQISADLRGDNIFALARKVSEPIERYPVELYTD